MSNISTELSSLRGFNANFTIRVLDGTADDSIIRSYEDYENIFRLRHDSIHWLICQQRELPFGEKKISELDFSARVRTHKYYNLVKDQTPDSIMISQRHIKIMELTISRMKFADVPKITKYRLLTKVLRESGYEVTLEVIVINSTFSSLDQNVLKIEHKFTDALLNSIRSILINVDKVIHLANESKYGIEWAAKFRGVLLEKVDFGISDEDVINHHRSVERKCFANEEDLRQVLESNESSELTNDEETLINILVEEGMKINSPLSMDQDKNLAIQRLKTYHQENQTKGYAEDMRSFMPLPYLERMQIDSANRRTYDDEDMITMLLGSCQSSDDPFLQILGTMRETESRLKIPAEVRFHEAIEGPGRRSYIIKGSIPHLDEQMRWKNVWFPLDNDYKEIDRASFELSQIDTSDELSMLSGIGLNYVRICQSIFREININALRKDRRHKYYVKPTGVQGVFVVIYPGPKLRTGENLSIIWFKVLVLREFINTSSSLSQSWIFKRLKISNSIGHSKWLSTDANRLDHYIRCYDKILMAYACYQSYENTSLQRAMTRSHGNTLGIIIMIYMENRRSTSKMLQDVRYMVMTVLSMHNYYGDVLKKFHEPLRSPLQSYLLTRIIGFITNPEVTPSILSTKFGTLNVESGTGEMFDKYAGSEIKLPRILTQGPIINFKQILCEMYFTMLFNKNQDDPTHSSFQILSKILEGEESLNEVKKTSKLHMGYKEDDVTDLKELINNPHKNQFSRRAVMIASKLQSTSVYNKANSGIAHVLASQSSHINKFLDEFATFKSSSTVQNLHYNSKVYQTDEGNEMELDDEDVKRKVSGDRGQQNRRRRCIEGVAELLEKNYMRSFDLIKNHLKEPIRFQLFKKNQIGGVREILILDIYKRVLINVLESFSKVICRDDDREMLTHGDKKVTLMRDLIRDLKRGDGRTKKIVMNYNFDKTRWAPSFMPIQFVYMFLPFKTLYPSLFRFIMISLINHSNKEFLLPERLMRVWVNDPNNLQKHRMDENLQRLKEEFLKTKKVSYINESNMGQGILHYTSSYFHLCFLSLRDRVYTDMCGKARISTGEWRDLVSSDDSYTAHAFPSTEIGLSKMRISLFLRAQEVCERVMNVWTSCSKSSISMLIYEFNSMFGSNMSMHPVTFKFALASVHPVNTDSFFRMTKESYIACRQIVENGGSMELYLLANKLNKRYCESIYHTHPGGQNDLELHGLRHDYSPYQLGVYPIMDPGLMIMFGPECHNYNILMKKDQMTEKERHVFNVMHTLVSVNDPEVYAAATSVDDVFVGVNRIEAHMGPISRLLKIRRNVGFTWEELNEYVVNNPLMIFNDPIDMNELKIKVFLKLFRFGASEALRTTAASIYYGRVSASVSANAFSIPFTGNEEPCTYNECMKRLDSIEENPINIEILYPHLDEFTTIHRLSLIEIDYGPRDPLETQNMRNLQLNKLQQRISNPITDLLGHYWKKAKYEVPTSYIRDWINLKESVSIIQDTLEETLEDLPGDKQSKVRSLLLVILRLMSYSSKPMKAIIFGPSSRAYDSSYLILKQQNMFSSATNQESMIDTMVSNITKRTDRLSFALNYFTLSCIKGTPINVNHLIKDDEVNSFFCDNSIGISAHKKMLLMLIYHSRIVDIAQWSNKTKLCFHKWVVRSGFQDGRYTGDFVIKVQLGRVVLLCDYQSSADIYHLNINALDNLFTVRLILDDLAELLGFDLGDFMRRVRPGYFVLTSDSLMAVNTKAGFHMTQRTIDSISLNPDRIEFKNNMLTLYDVDETIIIRVLVGLLHSDYTPSDKEMKEDILIQGLSLKKLCEYRPFNSHFSIENLSNYTLCNLLAGEDGPDIIDLIVEEPSVSEITNRRLKINYGIRDSSNEFANVLIEEKIEEDAPVISGADFFASVHTWTIPDLRDMLTTREDSFHDVWMDPSFDINILKTMTRQVITYHPMKILERVLNLKYQIITKLCTNVNMINKKTIVAAKRVTNNIHIVNSLIYSYDRQFSNIDVHSPDGCELTIYPEFDRRYHLQAGELNQ